MDKKINLIKDILENSSKAEALEKITEILDIKDSKMVLIFGIPNKENKGIDLEVWQIGHQYRYEQYGFIQEAAEMVMN